MRVEQKLINISGYPVFFLEDGLDRIREKDEKGCPKSILESVLRCLFSDT